MTSDMSDRVSVTPEPEPEPRDTDARARESGAGDIAHGPIVSDIGIINTSIVTQNVLPELQVDFDNGAVILHDPGSTDQGQGLVTLSHTEESQLVSTAPVTEAGGNMIMTTEDEARFVTDTQFVVLEQTQNVREWTEPEPRTLGSEPEPRTLGSVPEAGHGVTAHVTDVTHSPSSLDQHQEEVEVTPPRYEHFDSDSRPRVYLNGLNQINQEIYAHLDVVSNVAGDQAEVTVDNHVQDANQNDDDNQTKRKRRGPNKKIEKRQQIKAKKEERRQQYDLAISAYKDGKFENFHACAKHFRVNQKTLKKLIISGRRYVGTGDVSRVLTLEEESKIVEHLKWCRSVGFGMTYHTLQSLFQELLSAVVR